jgi:hypothetical protein
MTRLINIAKYAQKYDAYPKTLTAFCDQNRVKLPNINSQMGQAYALMAQPEIRGKQHIGRTEATVFFEQIGMKTHDSIQKFNKTIGLKRIKGRGVYCLVYPFECDMTDVDKRKGCAINGNRNEAINNIKKWWRKVLVDVPNDEWQVGHLDPTIADSSEKNLTYQPPIQARYRNRFKWDIIFHKMWPTADEWISNMDHYHTEAEQLKMLEALTKKYPQPGPQ